MSNAKPTRIEKTQKQIATRLKKVEKVLPAAWEVAARYGFTPEKLHDGFYARNSNSEASRILEALSYEDRNAIIEFHYPMDDLRRSLSDLQDALFCEAKRQASAAAKAEKEAAEIGLRMTCQICGRPILSNKGVIAHHGYQRPGDGYQTDSCMGARELPIEADTSILEAYIPGQIRTLGYLKADLARIVNEEVKLAITHTEGYGRKAVKTTVFVNRETFEATVEGKRNAFGISYGTTFDDIKNYAVRSQECKVRDQAEYVEWQQGRLAAAKAAGVTHVHDAQNDRWVKVHD